MSSEENKWPPEPLSARLEMDQRENVKLAVHKKLKSLKPLQGIYGHLLI